MRIFEEREPNRSKEYMATLRKIMELQTRRDQILKVLGPVEKVLNAKKYDYFNWLYENDRQNLS